MRPSNQGLRTLSGGVALKILVESASLHERMELDREQLTRSHRVPYALLNIGRIQVAREKPSAGIARFGHEPGHNVGRDAIGGVEAYSS